MKHLRSLLFVALLPLVLFVGACGAPAEDRAGTANEICFKDTDCRADLYCDKGLCKASGSNHDCSPVCTYLYDCSVEDYEACVSTCGETTTSWSDERFGRFQECLLEQNCGELREDRGERCRQENGFDCKRSCTYLSDCGVEEYDVCLGSCQDTTRGWSPEKADRFEECLLGQACSELRDGGAAACVGNDP